MENKFKKITIERIKKTIAVFILAVFCYNILAVPIAQANIYGERSRTIWEERQKFVQQMKKDQEGTLLAQLPSVNSLTNFIGTSESLTSSLPPSQFRISQNQGSSLPNWAKSLSLPLAYSNLKKAYFPPNWTADDPLVIHIQDIHLNKEAQDNIGVGIQLIGI